LTCARSSPVVAEGATSTTRAVTAKDLKNRTGAILKLVRGGDHVTVTHRGRPVATIAPPDDVAAAPQADPQTVAAIWADIELSLAATEPAHPTWQQAMDATRGRR
jgi:prevent-host-death family protein